MHVIRNIIDACTCRVERYAIGIHILSKDGCCKSNNMWRCATTCSSWSLATDANGPSYHPVSPQDNITGGGGGRGIEGLSSKHRHTEY